MSVLGALVKRCEYFFRDHGVDSIITQMEVETRVFVSESSSIVLLNVGTQRITGLAFSFTGQTDWYQTNPHFQCCETLGYIQLISLLSRGLYTKMFPKKHVWSIRSASVDVDWEIFPLCNRSHYSRKNRSAWSHSRVENIRSNFDEVCNIRRIVRTNWRTGQ